MMPGHGRPIPQRRLKRKGIAVFAFGTFNEAVIGFLLLFGGFGYVMKKLYRHVDDDGAVKKAAKDGAIGLISRLFKK